MTLVPVATWSPEQLEVVRQSVAPGCTDEELAFFAQVCRHKGLDPFAGEIVAIPRWDSKVDRNVLVIQETVAGLRALAERSGLYNGQDPPLWCGLDARWVEVWLDTKTPPAAAKVAVYRKGWDRPTVGIARYSSYVQLDKGGGPKGLWKTGPDFMLWKCAEAAALKRAFKHAMADAGITTRELSDASRISMEARAAGLDDDGRHALVAEVTGGRTDSTRDLTDQEALEVRAELARLRAEAGVDPETGERIDDEPIAASAPASAPASSRAGSGGMSPQCSSSNHSLCPGYYKMACPCGCGCHRPKPDAVARTIARGAGNLEARLDLLDKDQVETIKYWRRKEGLTRPVGTLSGEDRARIAAELDARGWASPYDLEPEEPIEEDGSDVEVVRGDVVEADLFNEEPF